MSDNELVRLPQAGTFPRVSLKEPNASGYLLLAGEVDRRLLFAYFLESGGKKALIADLKEMLGRLAAAEGVEATLFKALIIPPGRGAYLKSRPDAHIARFDVALIIRTASPAAAAELAASPRFAQIEERMRLTARHTYRIV